MSHYQPNIQDMQFVLSHVLNASDQLKSLPVFEELDDEHLEGLLTTVMERYLLITGYKKP